MAFQIKLVINEVKRKLKVSHEWKLTAPWRLDWNVITSDGFYYMKRAIWMTQYGRIRFVAEK